MPKLGLYTFYRRLTRGSDSLLVLLYHKVLDLGFSSSLSVPKEIYLQHLIYYKNNYRIFKSIEEWKNNGGSGVLITFDDGYYNNLSNVLPLHERLDIPLTIFTTTFYLYNRSYFWWDMAAQLPAEVTIQDQRCNTINHLMHVNPIEEKHRFISEHTQDSAMNLPEELRPLSAEELIKLSKHPLVTIGSHTVSHPRLSTLDYEYQMLELQHSKKTLEALLHIPISLFSYPHGGRTAFTTDTKRIAKKVGYSYAFAAYSGRTTKRFDPFEIPRVHIGALQIDDLHKKVSMFL